MRGEIFGMAYVHAMGPSVTLIAGVFFFFKSQISASVLFYFILGSQPQFILIFVFLISDLSLSFFRVRDFLVRGPVLRFT